MGHVANRLYDFLESGVTQLIQNESQENAAAEDKGQLEPADYEGVTDDPREIADCAEQSLEIGESDPWTAPNTFGKRVILECDDNAVHRDVETNKHKHQDGYQKQNKIAMFHVAFPNRISV